ncbi:NAD(P)-dependent oxidoreductase [Neobacillus cucumis]|uniref:NAD-dependent epimerase/dehydratase family protein n=1 Tax=Neobacillus cucumis TaxID=1740721 RepID=UPI002042673E|nr:NAD(P)-dependent oxidoreductase [Neobacillus cucumis]MCM3728647.1 NAD(P)-dependent oxidoreductase [Neobacillus cucumis]
MSVLITGGSGFVGINITERLLDEHLDVVNYATFPVPEEAKDSLAGRPGSYTYVEGDVLDSVLLDSVIKQYKINTIIHAAVITPDEEREKLYSRNILNVNYMGTVEVLEAARRNGIEKFIYLSSVSVYGDTAFEEDCLLESGSIPCPRTFYEISKFAAERTALRYKELFGLPVIAVRLGQIFGPWEHYTGIRHTQSGPFQALRHAALNQEAILPRPGLRDWVYSRDIANTIKEIIGKTDLQYDLYNIGSGHSWTVEQWCQLLEKEFPHFNYQITENPNLANVDFFVPQDAHPLAIERLQTDVGYYPKYGIEEAFQDYINWVKNTSIFWTNPNKRNQAKENHLSL